MFFQTAQTFFRRIESTFTINVSPIEDAPTRIVWLKTMQCFVARLRINPISVFTGLEHSKAGQYQNLSPS